MEAKPPLGDKNHHPGSVGFAFDPRNFAHMLLLTDTLSGEPRATHDGGRTWLPMRGCQDCFDATFDAGDVLAIGSWDSGSLLRSTNGGETFVPVSGVHDGVAFIRARPDGGPLAIVTRHAVRTGDPRTNQWRVQTAPLEAPPPEIEEQLGRSTFVPGTPGVLCIGINRWKPVPPMIGAAGVAPLKDHGE